MPSRTRPSILTAVTVGITMAMVALVFASDAGGPRRVAGLAPSPSPASPPVAARASAPIAVTTSPPLPGETISADVVVYGATPSGIVAAVSAARLGASVVLVTPESQVGGMMTSGLGHADVGRPALIGGLTRDVFARIGRAEGRGSRAPRAGWDYEPHVAKAVFENLLSDAGVVVYLGLSLDRTQPAERQGDRIVAMRMTNGTRITGRVFVDATYEGDLMAAAGVPYTVGRESVAAHDEPLAGVDVDTPAPPSILVSGLDGSGNPLPGAAAATIDEGTADGLVQSATFRLCVTKDPANRLPFEPPDGYDPAAYALVGRAIQAIRTQTGVAPPLRSFLSFARLPDGKADLNSFALYSTDVLDGGAAAWVNADDATRTAIWNQHRDWVAGLVWYLETDPAAPAAFHTELSRWGLCADEFAATGGWPPELYIREARRMVGSTVLTQRDVQQTVTKPAAIALGTYRIDAHFVRRILGADGLVRGDGQLSAPTRPYQIPYDAIVPPPGAVDNLLVGVTISATHVAWSSIRMEPTLMEIGEAAGVAAGLAVRDGIGVREVSPDAIRAILLAGRSILSVAPVATPPRLGLARQLLPLPSGRARSPAASRAA